MSIRSQLLLVGLSTLVLPWAGCQYARELEVAMRGSQEQALSASAVTIANALSAAPQRVFRAGGDARPFDPGRGDLYVHPLERQPLLDGYRDDWGVAREPAPLVNVWLADPAVPKARIQAAVTERYLFLYLEVDDAHFEPEPSNVQIGRDRFDRVDFLLRDPDGALNAYFFATGAPGLIEAQRVVVGDDGAGHAAPEPRIQAYWLLTKGGYHLEGRIPLTMVGDHLWIAPRDGVKSPPGQDLPAIERLQGGRLFFASSGLAELLGSFVRAGTRLTVVDSNGLKFGSAGSLDARGEDTRNGDLGQAWFRRLLAVDNSSLPERTRAPDRLDGPEIAEALTGHASTTWLRMSGRSEAILSAAAPITSDEATRGVVVLEQAGNPLVGPRDEALRRLFYMTIAATAVSVGFVFGFATWIGSRIGRLQAAAEHAIGSDGRIRLGMPESARDDEIGALARSFERMLVRLQEHTQYLRTLGGKLSHELRTPLTIVRSSLDNLESGGLRDDQRAFVRRAREGGQRLASILSALGAAARVEESIKQAEHVNFDMCEVLRSAAEGYQGGFPDARIALSTPTDRCYVRGAPELLVQMLDKFVENAVDYCPAGGRISIELTRDRGEYRLTVGNDGPPIPEAMLPRLFESLFEQRAGKDDKPHFGLGLYIARLIAEFHGGRVSAANREDASGACFTVILPMI